MATVNSKIQVVKTFKHPVFCLTKNGRVQGCISNRDEAIAAMRHVTNAPKADPVTSKDGTIIGLKGIKRVRVHVLELQ